VGERRAHLARQTSSASSDGGDATVIGTLQNKSLRTTYATRTETIAITLQQFDKPA
jgi:hypothetical protein